MTIERRVILLEALFRTRSQTRSEANHRFFEQMVCGYGEDQQGNNDDSDLKSEWAVGQQVDA